MSDWEAYRGVCNEVRYLQPCGKPKNQCSLSPHPSGQALLRMPLGRAKLNLHKSTGLDSTTAMIKLASSVIDLPMCSIFNSSTASNTYSLVWKQTLMKPLYNGGPHVIPHQLYTNFAPPSGQKFTRGGQRPDVLTPVVT